ncbi:MAG: hypothetical protein ACTSSA_11935 [Candidatus Freyarchaeota archaeon]
MVELKKLKGRVFSKVDLMCQQFAMDLAEEIWRTVEAYLEERSRAQLQEAVEGLLAFLREDGLKREIEKLKGVER